MIASVDVSAKSPKSHLLLGELTFYRLQFAFYGLRSSNPLVDWATMHQVATLQKIGSKVAYLFP